MGCAQSKLAQDSVVASSPTAAAAGGAKVAAAAAAATTAQPAAKNTRAAAAAAAATGGTTTTSAAGGGRNPVPKTRDRIDSWTPSTTSNASHGSISSVGNNPTATINATSSTISAATARTNASGSSTASRRGAAAAAQSVSSPATRERTTIKASPTPRIPKPPSSVSSRTPKLPSRKQCIEAQWRYLWETCSLEIVDPADVHAVLDSLKTRTINRLSAVEVTLLQRKVRAVVRSLRQGEGTGGGNNSNKRGSFSVTPLPQPPGGVMGKTIRAFSFHNDTTAVAVSAADAQKAVALAEKQHVLNETVLSKLLPAAVPDFALSNAYSLCLHLSPLLWDRVADLAALAAHKARLEMDVNKQSLDRWKMPKPSIVPEIEQPPELPSGITFGSLCFVTALALRGTRNQKLQLLFYLSVDNLGDFLDRHCAGGVPTFLLEVDTGTVVSLPSLTHYHYYGTAFLPSSSEQHHRPAPDFCASQSRPAVALGTQRLQQILRACCTASSNTEDSNTGTTTASAVPASSPIRRNSRSAEHLAINNNSHHGATAVVSTPNNNNSKQRRSRSLSNAGELNSYSVFPHTAVMGRLANNEWGDSETLAIQSALETVTTISAAASNTNTTVPDSMTLQEYAAWAGDNLPDLALDAILYRLFGSGTLPSPKLERESVQEKWSEWQTAWQRYNALQQVGGSSCGSKHDDSEGGGVLPSSSALERITQTVVSLMADAPCNGTGGSAMTAGEDSNVAWATAQTLSAWGGLAGLDGGGATGYGVLYCIDKSWWDAWAAHVGWTWLGDEPPPSPSHQTQFVRPPRPGALLTESLLDDNSEFVIRGTMGSYELMRSHLRKDHDYVLVPPGVWDVLYELYDGGPPLPRMVKPPERKFTDSNRLTTDLSDGSSNRDSFNHNGNTSSHHYASANHLDALVQSLSETGDQRVFRLPEAMAVALHPWILHVHLCDPLQPYRRGEAGPVSVRLMATPDEPLWRLYVEVITRCPLQAYKAFGPDNRGKARLWKKVDRSANQPKDPVSRYGPWNLLCKSRHATLPLLTDPKDVSEHYIELVQNWKEYADNATVESVGLADRDHVMLEFAVLNKNGDLVWPREAAAKAGRVRRLAEEDTKFRQTLLGLDDNGSLLLKPPNLVGMDVDAMDSTGRWYPVIILEADVVDDDTDEDIENDDDLDSGKGRPNISRKKVRVDFKEHGGHQEWIDVESDRIALAGRFTSETERNSGIEGKTNGSNAIDLNEPRSKPVAPIKKNSGEIGPENGKICLWPGFGACGLANLGNTCYVNSAIQCISYLPLLRSYLISAQYKSNGDLNKDNPLGTGGKLLEEFAELLRVLWSARLGEKSPTRFRSQLGKVNSQFSGADQQDAQEFLNYILDMLHEDSNKVLKKPYVEALEDDWVKKTALPRVGDEAWRRFLRRNSSIMTDVAMGQVLNTVTCPVCNFSSRNFDPFNLLSIPIPTVADVIFKCTVFRRATALNCPWVLNKPRKGEKHPTRFVRRVTSSPTGPPSETHIAEQYVIAMSRLADSGDLRLQIQNASGIPANQLRLCRAEELTVKKEDGEKSVVTRQMKVVPLADKEGPCSQLAKKRTGNEEASTPITLIVAFETTLRPRLMSSQPEKEEPEPLEDTADEDEEGDMDDDQIVLTPREQVYIKRYLEVYGDEQECRLVDTNPLYIAKALSRSLWPRTEDEMKLGLRVDARDHRGNWFPGNVVEIIEDRVNGGDADTGEELSIHTKKVRVHFDNFSSKWDELYTIDHFDRGSVRPLYAHASPRAKPTEFLVHNRHTDRNTGQSVVFGQSFYIHCQNEWSNARAGAHILGQASRYLRHASVWGSGNFGDPEATDREGKARRLYEKTQSTISDLIDLLVDCDREYVRLALGVSEHSTEQEKGQPFRNPAFDPTALSSLLVKKVSILLHRLPFELRVCTVDSAYDKPGSTSEEIPFPFSLIRTIGNYMNARHAVILQWREPPIDKKSGSSKSYLDAPVMYVEPKVEIDRTSAEILKSKSGSSRDSGGRNNKGGSGGIDLGVCLTEFCKVQNLTIADNWKCPHCKKYREGQQSMNLWRLPDLLTFHIKRFNMSARWREKITTKVNFPLTGLDMSEWCHTESPMIKLESRDTYVYDLIGVVNHYGSMTGGHYVATCKATRCGRDGKEEVAYNFNGVGANVIETGDPDEPTGWRLGRQKAEVNQNKVTAALSSQIAAESAEPLWLQFDDELVEPIPPRLVVSEMAYVLFYRRRRMTPSNIAKYSTLE